MAPFPVSNGKHQRKVDIPIAIANAIAKGLFIVSVANKWVPLIAMVLFTMSDAKYQRENR